MSGTLRFVISIILVLLIFTLSLSAAFIGSGPATGVIASPFISGFDGRYLGLVVLLESRLSLVQLLDGCHRADLLGRQVYLVSGLENIFVGGCVEGAITYVGPYVHREFVGPQGQDGGGAAAA